MALIDTFGRTIDYLRLSVTDRCDFRCVYCMSEQMQFLPRADLLTLEELVEVARAFTAMGVTSIRITGGEPLVRRNVLQVLKEVAGLPGLRELTLTTNGSRLAEFAQDIKSSGVKRVNISLDSLQPARFTELTRVGDLQQVLRGIEAARVAGFDRIKINSVMMKNRNADEAADLLRFALQHEFDISFIEEMPLGVIDEHQRREEFVSSAELRSMLSEQFELIPCISNSPGPSRYWRITGYASRVGFISPHSENFCGDCNRVRVTASGKLLLCLGHENAVDLRALLRNPSYCIEELKQTIVAALAHKPQRHFFDHADRPQVLRYMSMTGG